MRDPGSRRKISGGPGLHRATGGCAAARAQGPDNENKEVPMARTLKRGMDVGAIKAADAKVRETVEKILADIEARGEPAVRDLSQQFDNWAPKSFRLTPQEIERAVGQVAKRDL